MSKKVQQKPKPECKLVIAGPGAGKTHNMVEKVLACIEALHPTRFCAVITYTNAATEEIKSRLSKKVKIPSNVFIGTIHSFLNRFVVIPYVSLIDKNIEIDKVFLQISSEDIVRDKMKITGKDAAIVRKRLYESLNKKGLITFDQTISLALEVIKNQKTGTLVCKRLQFLFVDEFQDISNKHFEIIESIRKQSQTEIYCVGDPEQYISGFQYDMKYESIPILKIPKSIYNIENNINNHRCSLPIITFINNFNGRIYNNVPFQQNKVVNKNIAAHCVYFIKDHDLTPMIEKFTTLIEDKEYKKSDVYIIAKKNPTIESFKKILTTHKQVFESNTTTQVETMLNIITTVTKKSQIKIQAETNISKVEFRKFVLKCLKNHKADNNLKIADLKKYIVEQMKVDISEQEISKQHDIFGDLKKISTNKKLENSECFTLSNIHNVKGLESKVVLCIAKTKKELELWLETDVNEREKTILRKNKNDKLVKDDELDDYPRIGYVAFSRAKELLCIACQEEIDEELKNRIEKLNIQIIPI
ncbi:MAG: AAA family ATPase [Bacteroidota bacterium]|nr:AAA family ATPase [Bacteroidota bacterium]